MNINEETRQFATKSSNILVSNEKEKAVCFNLFYVFVVSAWLGKWRDNCLGLFFFPYLELINHYMFWQKLLESR